MKQDHPMTPGVLTSSPATPYSTLEPVAYALFSRNGYIRIWSIKGTDMPRLALALNAPLTPLVKQADHEAAVKAAYEAGRRDADKARIKELERQAKTEQQLQRAAKLLPEGYTLQVFIEKDAGWVDMYDSTGKTLDEVSADGSIGDQIEEAVNEALAQQGKEPTP